MKIKYTTKCKKEIKLNYLHRSLSEWNKCYTWKHIHSYNIYGHPVFKTHLETKNRPTDLYTSTTYYFFEMYYYLSMLAEDEIWENCITENPPM